MDGERAEKNKLYLDQPQIGKAVSETLENLPKMEIKLGVSSIKNIKEEGTSYELIPPS